MNDRFSARAWIMINAPASRVWKALVDPEAISQYMFGTKVVSDWQKGSTIIWRGEWHGKAYEDRGMILQFEPERALQYSHYSPLSGMPDTLENRHIVSIELTTRGAQTLLSLTQDNNVNEQERDHSIKNWQMTLSALKRFVEQ